MNVRPAGASEGQSEADAWRSLDLVLAWLSELVGFSIASVNVVRGDQLQVIALSGVAEGVRMDGTVEQVDQMLGTTWPVEELLATLELADDWGRFKFIPHERAVDSGPSGWLVTPPTPLHGPDSWHVEDALVAPLYDEEGTLVGCLSVDDPHDGRRPAESMRHLLDEYAEHVNLGLLNALQRSRLADRARILDETRTLMRLLSETPEADLYSMHERIRQAFHADGVVIHTFTEDGYRSEFSSAEPAHDNGAVESEMLERRARAAWQHQAAYATNAEDILATLPAGPEADAAAEWMHRNAVGSVLFAPLGAGSECLGSIVISRRPGRAPWTEQHREAALEFGQDLGRVLHARRVLLQEQRLVAAQRDLDRAKSQLLTAVSRELTTPLDAVTSLSRSLQTTAPDRRTLRALYRETHRVERVIDDLLLLSRLSDPDVSLPVGTVDLVAVAQRTIGVVEAARGVDVILRLRAPGPVVVRGSASELERALVRLVTYASLASPDDAPVFVDVEEHGSGARIVVDAGGDLTSAQPLRERLLADADGGELALTIADTAVRRHDGDLEICEGRQGVSFRLSLPLQA